jgi:hypothetical protein
MGGGGGGGGGVGRFWQLYPNHRSYLWLLPFVKDLLGP